MPRIKFPFFFHRYRLDYQPRTRPFSSDNLRGRRVLAFFWLLSDFFLSLFLSFPFSIDGPRFRDHSLCFLIASRLRTIRSFNVPRSIRSGRLSRLPHALEDRDRPRHLGEGRRGSRKKGERSFNVVDRVVQKIAQRMSPSRTVKLETVSLGIRKSKWLLRRNSTRCGWSISRYLSVNFNPFLNPTLSPGISLSQGWMGGGWVPGKLRIEVGKETLPSPGRYIFWTSFVWHRDRKGEVRSFAGTGSFNDLAESKLLLYAKDGDIDGLSQNERFFDFFSNLLTPGNISLISTLSDLICDIYFTMDSIGIYTRFFFFLIVKEIVWNDLLIRCFRLYTLVFIGLFFN